MPYIMLPMCELVKVVLHISVPTIYTLQLQYSFPLRVHKLLILKLLPGLYTEGGMYITELEIAVI